MRSNGAVALLVGARCFVEAVTFTALASIAHAATLGRDPLPVIATALPLFGAALVLVALLRETGNERRGATILVVTLAGGVAWGLSLPTRDADGFALLSRIVFFGLLAEAYLWRIVSIARGATRWTDARNAIPLAGLAIAVAVLGPGNVDRTPFAGLALLVVAASGLALSLARSTEELALSRGTSGSMRTSSATSAMVVIGVLAIAAAIFVPYLQNGISAFGGLIGPAAARVFYLLVLPFAYLAGWIVETLRPILSARLPSAGFTMPTPEEDERMQREIEAARPYVFGGVELLIVAIAVLVALVLLERMLRERRVALPDGVTLERERVDGLSLAAVLRSLRPSGRARRARPRDDGTMAGTLRALYWRFLELAERRGFGWRHESDTPGEHHARAASADRRWAAAAPLVRAFEDLRYGDIDPTRETVDTARELLKDLEHSTSPS